jgi:hypothetical protein
MCPSRVISVFYGPIESMMRHSATAFCFAIGASVAAIDCTHMEPLSNAYSAFAAPVGDRCGDGARGLCDVSIVELLAVPEKFHDKRVRVVGFGTLAFEGNTLCTSRHSGTGCLWLDIEGVKDPGFRKGWVVVEGRFDGEGRGHLGCCAGAIDRISVLVRARD